MIFHHLLDLEVSYRSDEVWTEYIDSDGLPNCGHLDVLIGSSAVVVDTFLKCLLSGCVLVFFFEHIIKVVVSQVNCVKLIQSLLLISYLQLK